MNLWSCRYEIWLNLGERLDRSHLQSTFYSWNDFIMQNKCVIYRMSHWNWLWNEKCYFSFPFLAHTHTNTLALQHVVEMLSILLFYWMVMIRTMGIRICFCIFFLFEKRMYDIIAYHLYRSSTAFNDFGIFFSIKFSPTHNGCRH